MEFAADELLLRKGRVILIWGGHVHSRPPDTRQYLTYHCFTRVSGYRAGEAFS